ncbi:MAG: hypothetical protein JJE04_05240, partial [Acidobacteriia bacterium]|nr:hypothetical protein [Terriglobia bacterium]
RRWKGKGLRQRGSKRMGNFDLCRAKQAPSCASVLEESRSAQLTREGRALVGSGWIEEGLVRLHDALRAEPGDHHTSFHLGNAFLGQGKVGDAIASYRRCLALKPGHYGARTNMFFALQYDAGLDAATVAGEHRTWWERYVRERGIATAPHENEVDPERRLRIGYCSPDFRRHPVSYFFAPVLSGHDPEQVEVFCYDSAAVTDSYTEMLKKSAVHWRRIHGEPDSKVDAMIRQDRIDLLVDLAGQTGGNRLKVFARKPAPVQVAYLGYPGTTGMSAMDYRISDEWMDPAGKSEGHWVEELVRVNGCCLRYRPVESYPDVGASPALNSGRITFGAFHRSAKLNHGVVACWSDILRQVERAQLLVHYGVSWRDDESSARATMYWRAGLEREFGKHGIGPGRLRVAGRLKRREHWALYSEVDIALDPFPYNGTTATCEALWMGVPVITLEGERHAGRAGVSLLRQAGLDQLVAGSREDYVALAVKLARDLAWQRQLRAGMRERVQAHLVDGDGLARELERAYRNMWRRWCARPAKGGDGSVLRAMT